ncbi:MAG: hypothetical protein IT353_14595 [Gemmatimonadaceae bacterium]|nr:hypothetical protein [Gemmatimonadaceae bacterium]
MNAISRRFVVLAALGVAAAPLQAQSTTATFLEYTTTVPAAWQSKSPSSSMRLAEYVAPGSAEVVVYYFGKGQGGSPEANLERWQSQFSNPTGGPVDARVTRDTTGAYPMTIAEYRGTYARGIGTGSDESAARPNHTLIAIVAETPRGTLFFQCFGPNAAVEAQRAAYLKFVKALK